MSNWKKGIKRKSDFTSKDIYTYYKETHDKPLDKKDYMQVIEAFNKKLIDKVYKGSVIQLPSNLGILGIKVGKSRVEFKEDGNLDLMKSNVSTDWGATNKLWKERPDLKHKQYVFHENLHTDGRRFKIAWSRLHSNVPALYYYRFAPARAFKRGLATFIKNNPNTEYYEF